MLTASTILLEDAAGEDLGDAACSAGMRLALEVVVVVVGGCMAYRSRPPYDNGAEAMLLSAMSAITWDWSNSCSGTSDLVHTLPELDVRLRRAGARGS